MIIETTFSCGDKAWVSCAGKVWCGTVGQVRVELTDTPGPNGGMVEPDCDIVWDNFKPDKRRSETYMLVETGIGSGSVYTLGEYIFATKKEAEDAMVKRIKEEVEVEA